MINLHVFISEPSSLLLIRLIINLVTIYFLVCTYTKVRKDMTSHFWALYLVLALGINLFFRLGLLLEFVSRDTILVEIWIVVRAFLFLLSSIDLWRIFNTEI